MKTQKIKYKLPQTRYFSMEFPETMTLSAGMNWTVPITFRPVAKVTPYHILHIDKQKKFEPRSQILKGTIRRCHRIQHIIRQILRPRKGNTPRTRPRIPSIHRLCLVSNQRNREEDLSPQKRGRTLQSFRMGNVQTIRNFTKKWLLGTGISCCRDGWF